MQPLLDRHPALTPTTLLKHLQEQQPDQDWSSLKRTLQRRVQQWKALRPRDHPPLSGGEAALPLLLKQLKLCRFRSHWQPLAQQAEGLGWSPRQFLDALCEQEVDHRQIAWHQRLLRDAHLPWQQDLDGVDHQHLEP